ncbi:MAG: hypothetical protein LBG95_00140 [Treponema sp.]|jgi:hypothetical protein|nr:hypothetical protein [Treponema sp.]
MSGNGSGRGGDNRGNRRKSFRRRERENAQSLARETSKNEMKRQADISPIGEGKLEKRRGSLYDRPKWVPPVPPSDPLPAASCAWCDKPIKNISEAISEPDTGKPVHLDCVINRIIERENLESGDTIGYIGGGRFGIIHYNNPPDIRDFKIKKIFEWENKELRSEWRVTLCDHFSVT